MQAKHEKKQVTVNMSIDEAIVLSECLQRLIGDNETDIVNLMHSSAEFAALCRLNNNLEKTLPELLAKNYEELLDRARKVLIKESGTFEGIEER